MKRIFLLSFTLLILASFITWASKTEQITDKEVLFWVTDPNPVRQEQVDVFHEWLKKNAPPEDQYILKIDAANARREKVIIQCVSGVGGDIIDCGTGDIQMFQEMGIIQDLTEYAQRMGFTTDKTYASAAPALMINNRQYTFPCNVGSDLYWTNESAFNDLNVTVPTSNWSFEEFEITANAFRKAAIKKYGEKKGSLFFLLNKMDLESIVRNWGIDVMNETLTASAMTTQGANNKGFAEALALMHRWTYKDRYLPSSTDMESISNESSHGGAGPQLFRKGQFAMYKSGRWALTTLRTFPDFKDLKISIRQPPQDGFANCLSGSRAAVMYVGYSDRRKHLASYFFQYLASDAYSQTIVDSADCLPPNPEFTETEAFLKPRKYPNEWNVHVTYRDALKNIGIFPSHSPFITTSVVMKEMRNAKSAVLMEVSRLSPEHACQRAHRRINERIQRNLEENPSKQKAFDVAVANQVIIDECKASGRKIPKDLITNRYYLKYYEAKGMLGQ